MDKRIESEGPELDRYWINLRAGNCIPEGAAIVHGICADTYKKAHAEMRNVRLCDCADCRTS